ncbi:MAG: hypothetical protein KJO75_02765 [Dactylosporangium sp.]|nr:hypothetical protein [Dactylosporangium sp.]
MPVTIGTIDQLLHAATRTRHVMLRHTGLAGRVVILDEVHAYDVYMTQFLTEALRWLADAGVPVILLSATLPPDTRMVLARAYLQGATQRTAVTVPPEMAEDTGYPVVRSLSPGEGQPRYAQLTAAPWRDPLTVAVDVLDEDPEDGSSPTGPSPVVTLLRRALSEGGCALVIRNTVGRAQQTYREIRASFGPDEVVLLHARLVVGARATRTEWALDRLGPPGHSGKPPRPRRLVVVATQLAEQSFDVDVDLLVTDLAPIDLLLQRVGRLHRHHRPPEARPAAVRAPAVVVTGMRQQPDAPPTFPRGSEYVYGRYPLLRAASLVIEATAPEAGSGWSVPDAVPALVRRGYDDAEPVPPSWRPAVDDARKRWHEQQKTREGKAEKFLLAGEKNLGRATLDGLHDIAMADLTNEDAVAAVVRDGPETVEVVLVRRDGDRGYLTLDGHHIDTAGAAVSVPEVAEAVAQSAVRLPPRPAVTTAAKDLLPLPECGDDPWLRRARVLVLDEARSAVLGGRRFTYDPDYGLLDETEAPDAAPRPRPGVFRNHPRSDSGGLVVN